MIDIKEAAKKYNRDINNSYIRTSLYEAAVKHYQAEMQAAGYEWVKVEGEVHEVCEKMYSEGETPQAIVNTAFAIGREQSKWISVEDRLPTIEDADENGKVLIYRETNPDQRGMTKSVYDWAMTKYCDSKTFWQPLPSPPKTDKP